MPENFSRARRQRLLVLTYHRIAQPGIQANPYYDHVISASPEAFQAQVELLADRYRIVHLDELPDFNSGRFARGGKPCVLITFDDGYRDNVDVALPILSRFGASATFFLTTAQVENPRLPWWDHVAYVIKHTSAARFKADRNPGDADPIVVELGENPAEAVSIKAIMTIIGLFLEGKIHDERWFLDQLGTRADVAVDGCALDASSS